MGHKDSKMVEEYYGHLAPENKSEAMARLPRFPALFSTETCVNEAAEQWANSGPTVGQTWRRGMVRMARMTHSRRCR